MTGRQEWTIRDYVALLLRRKWIIVATTVTVTLAAGFLSYRQPAMYRATSEVWLKQGDLAATLSGIQDNSVWLDPTRVAQTQIALASTPTVASAVLKRTGLSSWTPGKLLGQVDITAATNADLLDFSVTNHDPALAQRLANAYASQYTIYRRQLDTQALNTALRDLQRRIDELNASGQRSFARSLVAKQEQLRTLREVETSNATVVRRASGAGQVQPRPKRSAAIGFVLGLMLGIGLAFLRDALDTRIRRGEEIGERLGLPLLARIPAPPRQFQRRDRLVMLEDPTMGQAEAFRMLRTNLDFANLERHARSIMVTSALEGEGKSTTVANLAIAAARAGRKVALVDLDLRRPYLANLFDIVERPGLTNIVLGEVTVETAMTRVAIPAATHGGRNVSRNGNGHAQLDSFLDVLPSGPAPPDAGELVGTTAMSNILAELSDRYDLVLLDTPPMLQVGDALTLGSHVDAMLLVARLPNVRRPVLKELERVLEHCPVAKLGFVLVGADLEDGYGSSSDYYRYQASAPKSRGRKEREPVT
jgi:Mrp family chromosome partitioning ATPase/capsular polysaccharide biosynthesis protein